MNYFNSPATLVGGSFLLLTGLSPSAVEARGPVDERILWSFQLSSNVGQFTAVRSDGTIFVTDSTTLYALAPSGEIEWTLIGAGGGRPISFATDGTIYTGAGAVKAINPDGTLRWSFEGNSAAFLAGPNVGPDGNIYAIDNTWHGGIGTFSLDPDGNPRWVDPQFSASTVFDRSAILFAKDRCRNQQQTAKQRCAQKFTCLRRHFVRHYQ